MRESGPRKAAFALTVLAFLISPTAWGQTEAPQPQPVQPTSPWVTLIGALAWPVAATIMALIFRRPLGEFFRGLAARVTKLSAFKVELELAPGPSAAASPLLNDIRDTNITPATISDSTRQMLDQAQSNLPADFAEINLGSGDEWLTSRLFIAAVMLERMRGVKVFVFLEKTPATARRFIAVAPVAQLRWSLAQQFPWLEAAWVRAYLSIFPGNPQGAIPIPNGAAWLPDPRIITMTPPPITSSSGGLTPSQARNVVSQFIDLLQEAPPPATQPGSAPSASSGFAAPGTAPAKTQMRPSVTLATATQERADWVTRPLLEMLLPQEAFDLWAEEGRDAPRMRRTRSVLRRPAPFVALVRGDREFVRLVNRTALLEEIAISLGEEPESNHA